MPQFEVIRKAFGPKAPGQSHELLNVGDVVTADQSPGSAYKALDNGEAAQAASPAAVSRAKARAAKAAEGDKE